MLMKIMNPLEADEEWKRMKKIEETWLCLNHSGSFCYPSLKLGPLEHDMNFTLQIFPVLLCWPHLSGWTMEPDMATLPPGSDCSHMKNHVATHLCNTSVQHICATHLQTLDLRIGKHLCISLRNKNSNGNPKINIHGWTEAVAKCGSQQSNSLRISRWDFKLLGSKIQAIQAIQDGSVRSVRSSAPAEKVARMTCRPNPLDLVTWHSMAFPNLTSTISTDICASPKGTKKGSEFIAERSHGWRICTSRINSNSDGVDWRHPRCSLALGFPPTKEAQLGCERRICRPVPSDQTSKNSGWWLSHLRNMKVSWDMLGLWNSQYMEK